MNEIAWSLIEERVHLRFAKLAESQTAAGTDAASGCAEQTSVDVLLADLGWADVEAEFPTEASELLFRAQGRSLAQSDCLSRTMLAELSWLSDDDVNGVVLPDVRWGEAPGSHQEVLGIVVGPLRGRVAVPVSGPMGTVSIGVAEAANLSGQRLDTFDPSVFWTSVTGPLDFPLVEATTEWYRAVSAAQRGLATELIALADSILPVVLNACEHRASDNDSVEVTRHRLAEASAVLKGAQALLAESWRYGGRLSALTAKCAAGRAHRIIGELALQSLGLDSCAHDAAVGRYVARGVQLDALCGSHEHLEAVLGDGLFAMEATGQSLPTLFS